MSSSWSPAFAAAVHAALVRRCPPASEGAELAQLTQALVEALERGELDLPLTPDRAAVVQASGWLEGGDSPLLQRGERIGWRRWLEAMDRVVEEVLERQPPSLAAPLEAAEPPDTLNPEQQAAVLAMDDAAVVLLSGGPGTGKTSTVVELLQRATQRHPACGLGWRHPQARRRGAWGMRCAPDGRNCPVSHCIAGWRRPVMASVAIVSDRWSWICWWLMRCRWWIWG